MRKQSKSYRITFAIAFILFSLYAALLLFFFVFGFLIAIKKDMLAFTMDQIDGRLFSWPMIFAEGTQEPYTFFQKIGAGWNGLKIGLKNFAIAFEKWEEVTEFSYLEMTWHSVWRTLLPTFLSSMNCAMVTYILACYRNRLTRIIYTVGLIVMMVPLYGSGAATYRLMHQLGLIDTPLHYLTCITLFGGHFFYMYAFWKALSWGYAEAAFIDGANHYTVFFKIMLPMVLPSMSALIVMSLIGEWNAYENTLLYMQKFPNLSYGIYAYGETAKYNANVPAYFAGVLIALVPVLILYIIFQDTIMGKVYLGGLKG